MSAAPSPRQQQQQQQQRPLLLQPLKIQPLLPLEVIIVNMCEHTEDDNDYHDEDDKNEDHDNDDLSR